jgi:hypothetical protein
VDANQAAIVEALRKFGATVQSLAMVGQGTPDLLVGFRRQTYLMEVKDGSRIPSEQRLTAAEQRWHAVWFGGTLKTVRSVDEALAVIGVGHG